MVTPNLCLEPILLLFPLLRGDEHVEIYFGWENVFFFFIKCGTFESQ